MKAREGELVTFKQVDDKRVGGSVVELCPLAVQLQENKCRCNGDPLVAIDERMISRLFFLLTGPDQPSENDD